jgi:hypothetical protein
MTIAKPRLLPDLGVVPMYVRASSSYKIIRYFSYARYKITKKNLRLARAASVSYGRLHTGHWKD